MNLEQFHQVLEIAKVGSMNVAANNLFISQASLSISIKKLEKELPSPIFIRSNKGVRLTPFGHEFISYILPICIQVDQLKKMKRNAIDSSAMSVHIANNGFGFVAPLCAAIYEKYKKQGINIYAYDCIGDKVIESVANNETEIGLLRVWNCYKNIYEQQIEARHLEFNVLADIAVGVLVGEKNPLYYSKRSKVTSKELQYFPMVLYSYLHSGPYSDIFEKMNIVPANKIITDSRSTIYEMLQLTDAFYVSSDFQFIKEGERRLQEFRFFPLEGTKVRSIVGWVQRDDYIPTDPVKVFLKELKNLFKEK